MGLADKLKKGLAKTKAGFVDNIQNVVTLGKKIDRDVLEELEELLILSDVGVETSEKIIENLEEKSKREPIKSSDDVINLLKRELAQVFKDLPEQSIDMSQRPHVISVIGVNGTGKTTTIGKLANILKQQNKKVMLAAADTFRAAAIEQLCVWAERTASEVIQPQTGADPASVAYDAYNSAVAKDMDVLIIDTAGRLHTKVNLMAELDKIHRVIQRQNPNVPHQVLMVMDATTGQNGLVQAKKFAESVNITGIVLTKLDGTAKGGIVFSIVKELGIPVRYIGLGEQIDDLQEFDADLFVEALFQ